MGFVASPSTQLVGQKMRYEPTEAVDEPTVGEIAGAFFRQENIVGSIINKEVGMPDEFKDDPSFDAYSFFTDAEKLDEQFVTAAIMADNEDEIEATRKQIAREREDRDIMARGGATSFIVGLPVAVADPLSIVPSAVVHAYVSAP